MIHAGDEVVDAGAIADVDDGIPGERHRIGGHTRDPRLRGLRGHRIDVDVDDWISVLVGHVRRRRHASVPSEAAFATEGPVVVPDVLLDVAVHRPSVVGEIPVIVVGVVLVKELDPTGRVARSAPEVPVEIPVPVVVARIRVEAVERIPLRVGADQRIVGDDGRGPHVGMIGAPSRRIAVRGTRPRRTAGDSDRNQDCTPHAVKLGRPFVPANPGC